MKNKSKQQMLYWGVNMQINSRPNKLAKGMAFTNERRARIKGKSVFYSAILTNNRSSKEARSLSVRGTLDKLNAVNSVSMYNMRRFKAGLPQQKKIKNEYSYLKYFV